jgi:hypothetical protein
MAECSVGKVADKLEDISSHIKQDSHDVSNISEILSPEDNVITQNVFSEIYQNKDVKGRIRGSRFVCSKKISYKVFIAACDKQRYIIKHTSEYSGEKKTSWVRSKLKKQRFYRECLLTKALSAKHFTHLKTPRFIGSDNRTYVMTELVEGAQHFRYGTHSKHLIKAIYEFNTSLKIKRNWIDFIDRFTRRPLPYAIKNLWLFSKTGMLSKKDSLRAFYLCITLFKKQYPFPFIFLLHNDLGNAGNTLRAKDGTFYILDFGEVVLDNRLVLWDIIAASLLDREEVTLDFQSVHEYYMLLPQYIREHICQQTQVHFCLLARFFRILQNQYNDCDSTSLHFFRSTLLSKKQFSKWYQNNRFS